MINSQQPSNEELEGLSRDEMLQMIQLYAVTALLGGAPLSDELEAKMNKAIGGDTSINLIELMQEILNESPDDIQVDLDSITFNEGKRAEARGYSIAYPDGWTVLKDFEEEGFLLSQTRDFVIIPPEANPNENISLSDRIYSSDLSRGAISSEQIDEYKKFGIEPYIQLIREKAAFDAASIQSTSIAWMEVIKAQNVKVLAYQIASHSIITLLPIANAISTSVMIDLRENAEENPKRCQEIARTMAKTVKLKKTEKIDIEEKLERACSKKVMPKTLLETIDLFGRVFYAGRNSAFENGAAAYTNRIASMEAAPEKTESIKKEKNGEVIWAVNEVVDYTQKFIPYFNGMLDAYECQTKEGMAQKGLQEIAQAIVDLLVNAIPRAEIFPDEVAEILKKKKMPVVPDDLQQVLDRAKAILPEEALQEIKIDGEAGSETSKASKSARTSKDSSTSTAKKTKNAKDAKESKAKAAENKDAEATEDDVEIEVVDGWEGLDLPALMMNLLSGDWLFFNPDDIVWKQGHHEIVGIQANAAKLDEFMPFVWSHASDFDDLNDIVNYFIAFMREVEKDDGLIVPRKMIAKGLHEAIRKGDLTGITLANLAACGSAFMIQQQNKNRYIVLYDVRLAAGIPSFFDLIARLMWDLRQLMNSMKDKPFEIIFLSARNFDAEQVLGNVDRAVVGAQECPGAMRVTKAPIIKLPTAKEIREAKAVNDVLDGTAEPELELNEMVEGELYGFTNSVPMTLPIEGTHHHGRAERIEDVKVGDELLLRSDWDNEFFKPVAIEVFNEEGTLGYLSEGFSFPGMGHTALAAMLPHVKASVESVTPRSQRRKNAKYALMDVKIELDGKVDPYDGSREYYVKEAAKLLAKPVNERDTESIFEPKKTKAKSIAKPKTTASENVGKSKLKTSGSEEGSRPAEMTKVTGKAKAADKLKAADKTKKTDKPKGDAATKKAIKAENRTTTASKKATSSTGNKASQESSTDSAITTIEEEKVLTAADVEAQRQKALQEREQEVSNTEKMILKSIRKSGGNIDIEDLLNLIIDSGEHSSLSRGKFSSLYDILKGLIANGLVFECEEEAYPGIRLTKCNRFYAWDRIDEDGNPAIDLKKFQAFKQKELDALLEGYDLEPLEQEERRLWSELGNCSFFQFSKKNELKQDIALIQMKIRTVNEYLEQNKKEIENLKKQVLNAKAGFDRGFNVKK